MVTYLVVEDDPVVSKILKHIIRQSLGDHVVYASTLQDALYLLKQHRQTLAAALVDVCLPDAPNGEAVDAIVTAGVPCVVLTASNNEETRQRFLQSGIADYVTKDGRYWYLYAVKMLERLERNHLFPVLVVDDSKVCRNTMIGMLETHRYPIIEASSAEEALEHLGENPEIRIMVVEHELPGMNGLELVQMVRYKYSGRPIGIIAISGVNCGREQLTVDFIKSGADDFLPKPFDHQEFTCRITNSTLATEAFIQLQEQASKDYLTGMFNRRYFSKEADERLDKYNNVKNSMALLDIDFFKKTNDEFGHQAGDIVLKTLSAELLQTFSQLLSARVGGEEFAILMPGINSSRASALMDGFRRHIEGLLIDVEDGDLLRITVSIGICTTSGGSAEQMFSVADECLYRAKLSGRNKVVSVDDD